MCVEDNTKEFEMECELQEPQEQAIAWFLRGLNKEIADIIELQPFVFLKDVIKLAIKVERQRGHGSSKQGSKFVSTIAVPQKLFQNGMNHKRN